MLQPKQTPKQKKNIKDATQMKNMRPTGPTSGRVKPTLGGAKNGKSVSEAKNGKSFPDLNKDGKITKADILKGRGVIAKNGKPVEKAFLGKMLGGVGKSVLGGLAGKAIGGLLGKDGKTIKKSKSGTSMKKCKYGCK